MKKTPTEMCTFVGHEEDLLALLEGRVIED